MPSKIKLAEKINTIEKDNINLTDKIQSMSKGAEKLSERIHTVEFNNQNLLKSYDKLADKSISPRRQSAHHPNNVQG